MSLLGDCGSSVDVVASAHAYGDTCRVANINSVGDTRSERVNEAENSNHGKASLNSFLVLNALKTVVFALNGRPFVSREVDVGNEDSAVGLISEAFNHLADDFILLVLV